MYMKSFTGKFAGLYLLLVLLAGYVQAGDIGEQLSQNMPQMPVPDDQPSGRLLLPAEQSASDSKEKKCMTVCASWGEECSYINRGSGGTTRSCRRTCQQYTEECF